MQKVKKYLLMINCIALAMTLQLFAQAKNVTPLSTRLNINDLSSLLYNNGTSNINGANPGFYYPKGSFKTVVYCSGLIWGANVNNKILSGGSSYHTSLVPGKINSDGTAQDPNSISARTYRVRKDYKQADLNEDAVDMNKTVDEIYQRYQTDWNEWPANSGAPFNDVNGDGKYSPAIDIPGMNNADQTIWFVANDLDSDQANYFNGSSPMGIEMQCSVWGYSLKGYWGNSLYKEYRLINKSKNTFKDMYVGAWFDVDLGGGSNDLVGCDTLLNLGFMYNSDDLFYSEDIINGQFGNKPPAFGCFLMKGPTVEKKNLGMTALSAIYKNFNINGWQDANELSYEGTKNIYNFLQGKLGDGTPHPLPMSIGNGTTKFPYSGDPVNNTGFVAKGARYPNGIQIRGADYRFMVCSGPFSMAPGDTQVVRFAEVAALGENRLASVTLLKDYVRRIANRFGVSLPVKVEDRISLPHDFMLSQNFPNPFNPSTAISYKVSAFSHVTLKVYDVLGREVATLVNEEKAPGNYEVKFNVETLHGASLPSGIYFYRLQAGDFIQTKKMQLLK